VPIGIESKEVLIALRQDAGEDMDVLPVPSPDAEVLGVFILLSLPFLIVGFVFFVVCGSVVVVVEVVLLFATTAIGAADDDDDDDDEEVVTE
jgi:hypothetical protein